MIHLDFLPYNGSVQPFSFSDVLASLLFLGSYLKIIGFSRELIFNTVNLNKLIQISFSTFCLLVRVIHKCNVKNYLDSSYGTYLTVNF